VDDNPPVRATYYADAASWSEDVNGVLRASRKRAWIIAGAAASVAVLEALALVLLVPLKTVVPYTITVDRQTGSAQLARGVNLGPMNQNEALIQSAVAQYVIARETLDATDLAANYRKVGLWSASTARIDYLRSMDRKSPDSVLIGATVGTEISTIIKQVTMMSPTSALVRFATDRRDGDGPVTRSDWAAVMQFAFTGGPLSMEDRLINPLGFQVTHYRRDAETIPAPVGEPTAMTDAIPAVVRSTTPSTSATTSQSVEAQIPVQFPIARPAQSEPTQ
jgi:type IV secretion system protein VirB8